MFDDQTTSRWIPRNQLGLPVYGYSQASGTQGQDQAAPPAQPLQSFDATLVIATSELGWDDDELPEHRPQVQELTRPSPQPVGSIEPQPVASPVARSQWELAADIARIRARPRMPLWLRTLVPGVGVFAAVLFGVVIVFVEPSSAKPAVPTMPAPVAAVVADSPPPAPTVVATPAVESVRHVPTKASDVADEPVTAAVGGGRPGTLRLNSRPWSQVFVDGQPIGHTPIMGVPLKAGEHRVELVNEALNVRKTIQLKIKPGEVVTKIVLLVD